ncbi:MAG: penicillin-binding protein 2, partial [Myxococcaceae bacterium]
MTLGQNSPGKDLRTRYLWVGGAMLLGLLMLAGRLYRLQITEGDEYALKSIANFEKPIPIPAYRGMILDRRGQILVDNRASFDAFITPAFCLKCGEDTLPKLATYLGWDATELQRISALVKAKSRGPEKYQRIPVRVDLTRDEMDVLFAHMGDFSGFNVDWVPHRSYPAGPVLAHVVGYLNEISQDELDQRNAQKDTTGIEYHLGDYIGRRGVEQAFENQLRGKDGIRKEVVDARGQLLPKFQALIGDEGRVEPVPGNNVVLSIDYRLQEAAEKAFPAVAGSVIVVDVRTGFILALVSRPSFDPNMLTGRVTPQQMGE